MAAAAGKEPSRPPQAAGEPISAGKGEVRVQRLALTVALVWVATLVVGGGAAARPLVVASTPDLAVLVRAVAGDSVDLEVIMPAGADPHTVSVSASQIRSLGRAGLIVLAHSRCHEFESVVKAAVPPSRTLDWPDYAACGASLHDYPGYPQNPHGPWLRLDNARAMAEAIAPRLTQLGVPAALVQARLQLFTAEVQGAAAACRRLAAERHLAERPVLAVIPGVCDIVANLGAPVGAVLMAEGSGTVSGRDLQAAVQQLRSGAYAGIVCPLSMKQSRPGEAARQVAADSGAPLVYVRFLDTDPTAETYLAVNTYNTAALAGLGRGTLGPVAQPNAPRGVPATLALAAAAGLALGVALGLALRRRRQVVCGAGIFDETD